jgi:hypothetical protein
VSAYLDELATQEEHATARKPRRRPTPLLRRSLALLRREGYRTAVVERWNAHVRIRQDCYGFMDGLAIAADRPGALAVQATDITSLAAHREKLRALPAPKGCTASNAVIWLQAGNRIELHGWARPTKTRRTWRVVRELVTLEMLRPISAVAVAP